MKQVTKKKGKNEPVMFPITSEQFEALAQAVIKKYDLPDSEIMREFLATSILHAPGNVGAAPMSYFGSFVRKGLSNIVAYDITEASKQKLREQERAKKLAETNTGPDSGEPVPN